MPFSTRLSGLAVLVCLIGMSACQRRSQALFMPERHTSHARVALLPPPANSVVVLAGAVAQPATESTPEPAGLTASASPDVARYQQLSRTMLIRPERLSAPTSVAKRPVVTSDRVARKQLRRQLTQQAASVSGLAVASLVCGIVAFFVFGIVLGILATIFGAVALSKIRKNPEVGGRGLAVAGLILGIVATIVTIIYLASR